MNFKKIILLGLVGLMMPLQAFGVVYVSGYYKSNGTYVKPHVRSDPNGLKYDNYSWKPSQGLYNDSYGTRGSSWDTPSWTTDPDYYVGKSLYDNRNSTKTKPSYAVPSYTSSSLTNSYSGYPSYKSNKDCEGGEFAYYGSCYSLPKHARKDSYSGFSCKSGYKETGYGSSATCQKNVKHGYYIGSYLSCNYGYRKVGSRCERNSSNNYSGSYAGYGGAGASTPSKKKYVTFYEYDDKKKQLTLKPIPKKCGRDVRYTDYRDGSCYSCPSNSVPIKGTDKCKVMENVCTEIYGEGATVKRYGRCNAPVKTQNNNDNSAAIAEMLRQLAELKKELEELSAE